jgi:hypothetical protein
MDRFIKEPGEVDEGTYESCTTEASILAFGTRWLEESRSN